MIKLTAAKVEGWCAKILRRYRFIQQQESNMGVSISDTPLDYKP